ncbi:TraR/DksA C4-type zinc finger protein [Kitasatospora sp. NPDC052896]|uniref:TraR/DksA C4-type zinc finger protein n=1 Tax=Kitasatospora sp. NPDC052896 TaxID=3364061 RepID=UPI0037CC75D4
MSSTQKDHFRRLLLQQRDQVLSEAGVPNASDEATQQEESELKLRTRDRERKLIEKIDEALFALDKDHYGYCNSCGTAIGLRRLEARPTTTLCADCNPG